MMEAYFYSSGAHNAYITYFLMFGIPLGIVISAIKIHPVYISFFNHRKLHYDDLYSSIKILGLIYLLNGFTESIFTGVNAMVGVLYLSVWINLAYYSRSNFRKKMIIHDSQINKYSYV